MSPLSPNEDQRIAALHRYKILDTDPETAFDSLTRAATSFFGVPIALISLVDKERQWFKSRQGLSACETSRDVSFCSYAILGTEVLVVLDATQDPRFAENALVRGSLGIRFYAGAPLRSSEGYNLGSLCIIDSKPRAQFSEKETLLLRDLAHVAAHQIELRLASLDLLDTKVALEHSQERYALAIAGANDGIWDWDITAGSVFFSNRWCEMLGLGDQSIDGTIESWLARLHREEKDRVSGELFALLAGTSQDFHSEHRILHEDGTYRWVLNRAAVFRDRSGSATRMAGSQTDITESKTKDLLTGLPNELRFLERLADALARLQRQPGPGLAILTLDIDNFKSINDSLGHDAGDYFLRETARRLTDLHLQGCSHIRHFVARHANDVFLVLLENLETAEEATVIVEQIRKLLLQPAMIEGRNVSLSASAGIALGSEATESGIQLLRNANSALHAAKEDGRGQTKFFDASLRDLAVRRLALESDLRRGLERGEFVLYYQPQIHLSTKELVGFEALVRWRHPVHGLIPPVDFIPLAETTGFIVPLGKWILHEACRQVAEWNRSVKNPSSLRVSVNVSCRQFSESDLAAEIEHSLRSNGLPASCLRLEITESVLMADCDTTRASLLAIKALGVAVEMDDFGTGYSSLSYLNQFPFDALKIDRSFVQDLFGSGNSEIVRSTIALAQSLSLEVVAEGIETEDQMAALSAIQCSYGQGYLISPPLDLGAPGAFENYILDQSNSRNLYALERCA